MNMNVSDFNHNFSLNISVTVPTKQEGEECGMCLNPDTDYFCGSCAHGLECLKSLGTTLIPDAPSRCTKKPGNIII